LNSLQPLLAYGLAGSVIIINQGEVDEAITNF